jgi:hypothetical protein
MKFRALYDNPKNVPYAYIYCLLDPFTKEPFYIGKTHISLRERLHLHISDARRKGHTPNARAILTIMAMGGRPIIQGIETVPWDDWRDAEKFWIKLFKKNGHKLTNVSAGGGGC